MFLYPVTQGVKLTAAAIAQGPVAIGTVLVPGVAAATKGLVVVRVQGPEGVAGALGLATVSQLTTSSHAQQDQRAQLPVSFSHLLGYTLDTPAIESLLSR